MEIKFEYLDREECYLDTKYKECCCQCENRLKVKPHPWNVENYEKYIENGMGFYVCIIFDKVDKNGHAMISGEHGACECFQRRVEISG